MTWQYEVLSFQQNSFIDIRKPFSEVVYELRIITEKNAFDFRNDKSSFAMCKYI